MAEEYNFWDGTCGNISGSTSFGFYDNDSQFQHDGPRVANFCVRKLGYPAITVELDSGSIFECFEEAINEYSAQVNQFNIKDNLLEVKGINTDVNLTHLNVASSMGTVIKIAESYGTAAGLYSNVEYHTGSIDVVANKQTYNIDQLFTNIHHPNKNITITRVHHYAPAALARYYDPYAGTGMGTYSTMAEFGFDNMSPATTFLVMPIFEDILRIQAIEFNDVVRRSAYTFKLYNNHLKLFPIPRNNFKLWFEYYIDEDRNNATPAFESGSMSDFSNVTYNNMQYSNINDVGKQWIRNYALALCKELLGYIRRKYNNVPIPGGELSLDGDTLVSDGKEEREALITQLREMLEETSKKALIEAKQSEAENQADLMRRIPTKIYIG